jgi:hypothetical protein
VRDVRSIDLERYVDAIRRLVALSAAGSAPRSAEVSWLLSLLEESSPQLRSEAAYELAGGIDQFGWQAPDDFDAEIRSSEHDRIIRAYFATSDTQLLTYAIRRRDPRVFEHVIKTLQEPGGARPAMADSVYRALISLGVPDEMVSAPLSDPEVQIARLRAMSVQPPQPQTRWKYRNRLYGKELESP